MPSYDVAHIQEQSQDIIMVVVSSSFGNMTQTEQNEQQTLLQLCASDAGLVGVLVPVWNSGSTFGFHAPRRWQSFFRSIDWDFVCQNINRKLTCN